MNWQTTYTTLATVMEAGFQTLNEWNDKLPAPQTDVERTIRRRIKTQMDAQAIPEIRKTNPELADKVEAAFESARRLFGRWPL